MIFIVVTLLALLCVSFAADRTMVMTMMLRDEAVNIRANLPLYASIPGFDYFVFLVDHRTQDDTYKAIEEVLGRRKQYVNISYEFEGFGSARTLSLETAWKHFPQATFVWISDPDWRPDVSTINLNELYLAADAYRFKIYDRNGFTTRRCDWLLRHRAGLKMKYHLHEVLDIGLYSHQAISFVVHEIEKPGTWHTTVGHGNSMSSKRSLFDLSMLYKDLEQYGHEAHVDYYLGVTHESYATSMISAGHPRDAEMEDHIEKALKYNLLRLRTHYDDEFIEQRVGIFMMLGQSYDAYQGDFVSGEKWLATGRDYSLNIEDNAAALVRHYFSVGALSLAAEQVIKLLKLRRKDRIMMNYLRLWNCDIPYYGLEVYGYSAAMDQAPFPDFIDKMHSNYMILLLYMARRDECVSGLAYNYSLPGSQIYTFVEKGLARHGMHIDERNLKENAEKLCTDQAFYEFLLKNEYQNHICNEFRAQIANVEYCTAFNTFLPPPIEEDHIYLFKEFLGGASLVDIAHNVYGGNHGKLLPAGQLVYRVLFARYFNPTMIYALIGSTNKDSLATLSLVLEITVVTPNKELAAEIMKKIDTCKYWDKIRLTLNVIDGDLSTLQRLSKYDKYFNYIEYYGGGPTEVEVDDELKILKKVLHKDGAIGMSYFTKNVHVENVARMVVNRNRFALLPFSDEPERLALNYLTYTQGLVHLNQDTHLINFLASGCKSNATFTPSEVESVVSRNGFKVRASLPTGYSRPFDELKQYTVQKFYDLGVSQEEFLYSMMVAFRNTIYITNENSVVTPGRVKFFENIRPMISTVDMNPLLKKIEIVVRSPSLTPFITAGASFAKASMSMQITLSMKTAPMFNLSYSFMPSTLAALSSMTNGELFKLFESAASFMSKGTSSRLEETQIAGRFYLLETLDMLERFNLVTVLVFSDTDVTLMKNPDYISERTASSAGVSGSPAATGITTVKPKESTATKEPTSTAATVTSNAAASTGSKTVVGNQKVSTKDYLSRVLGKKKKAEEVVEDEGSVGSSDSVGEVDVSQSPELVQTGVQRVGSSNPSSVTRAVIARQTRSQLMDSHRSMDCASKLKANTDKCKGPKDQHIARPSADLTSVSAMKLRFDISQLRYIALEDVLLTDKITLSVLPKIQALNSLLPRVMNNSMFHLSNSDYQNVGDGVLNRILTVSKDIPGKDYLYPQTLTDMKSHQGSRWKDQDFIGFEVACNVNFIRQMGKGLLQSTIWFDSLNGMALASHMDDGLVQDYFGVLSQEIADSFVFDGSQYSLSNYFAVAMDLFGKEASSSPILMADPDEVIAVLWVNERAAEAHESKADMGKPIAYGDGLVVYETSAAKILEAIPFERVGQVPNFLMKTAMKGDEAISYSIPTELSDSSAHRELILRSSNRLVVVGPGRPFYFSTASLLAEKSGAGNAYLKKPFDQRTMLALVVVLKKK